MKRTLIVLGYIVVFYIISPHILGYSHTFFKVNCEYSKQGAVIDPVCLVNSNGGLRFGVTFTNEYNVLYVR